jgi:hypothetical protein
MSVNEFKIFLREFSQAFDHVKSLCEKIRDIFFSLLKNEALFIEISSTSSKELYRSVIEAFDSAIVDIVVDNF